MTCKEIIFYILVPLISAIVGGLITLVGVNRTIKYTKESTQERDRLAVRPYMINLLKPKLTGCTTFYFSPLADDELLGKTFVGSFENSDNGLLKIICIQTEKAIYYPKTDYVVNKGKAFLIYWELSKSETLKDMKIIYQDVFENEYVYQLKNNASEIFIGKLIEERPKLDKKKHCICSERKNSK